MNRTLKEATVRRYHYETHDALRAHLGTFLDAYNFARRLKTLRGLTPFEFISQRWTSEPHRFRVHPDYLIPGRTSSPDYAPASRRWSAARFIWGLWRSSHAMTGALRS